MSYILFFNIMTITYKYKKYKLKFDFFRNKLEIVD